MTIKVFKMEHPLKNSVLGNILMRISAYSCLLFIAFFCFNYLYGGVFPFVFLIAGLIAIVYNAQDRFLYYPEVPSNSKVLIPIPHLYGMPYENVFINSLDGTKIHMYFIKQPDDKMPLAPTVVFFHGNAGNIGHRLPLALCFYDQIACNLLMVEYRGYGMSDGTPSEEGLYMDARASVDYLLSRSDVNCKRIIIFGRSLGGAVAIDLAARPEYAEKVWCLIVENTFTSIPDMAKTYVWRRLAYVPTVFYKNKYLSALKVSSLRVPALFISGLSDTLVPPRMMYKLHAKCRSEWKQLVQLRNGTHNDTWAECGYFPAIRAWLHCLSSSYSPNIEQVLPPTAIYTAVAAMPLDETVLSSSDKAHIIDV